METGPIRFTKAQKTGIIFLLSLLLLLQLVILYFDHIFPPKTLQSLTIPAELQSQYDSLQKIAMQKKQPVIYPFNPNYLSESKAYYLGIDIEALNRIEKYRTSGKYFQSKDQFKSISGISDSLFYILEPYINIPNFKKYPSYSFSSSSHKIQSKNINLATASDLQTISGIGPVLSKRIVKYRQSLGGFNNKNQLNNVYGLEKEVIDKIWKVFYLASSDKHEINKISINSATANDLKKVNGIGDILAERIIKLRERNGGFAIKDELQTVYGLKPEIIERLWDYFDLKNPKKIQNKISLNDSNIKELAQHPYIDYNLAKKIVSYRTLHGGFKSFNELKKIQDFPANHLKIIKIYLELE